MRRVLKADGVLMAATNGETHMHELHDLARRFDVSYAEAELIPRKFSLENGGKQLSKHFSDVGVMHKENQLIVTEAEPLVAYMLSGTPASIGTERETELRAFVAAEMAEKGAMRITPDTGLLVARV